MLSTVLKEVSVPDTHLMTFFHFGVLYGTVRLYSEPIADHRLSGGKEMGRMPKCAFFYRPYIMEASSSIGLLVPA
jgi:hypothetical protein